jgi:HAD superfamily phosphatase (TIGR01681 family)
MTIIENELVVVIDCDGTLITPDSQGQIVLPYGSGIAHFSPIKQHVDLLKEYKNRGFTVVVWSMGGWAHAKRIVDALKLERYVDLVLTKPCKHVDDKEDVGSIIGTRVFIA